MVLGITGLNYVVEDGTIIVAKADAKDFNMAKQDMTLIPVKYVSASALAEFLNKNIFAMQKPGLSGEEIVTTNPATNELIVFGSKNDATIAKKIVEKFDKKPQTSSFKVNYTTPAEMADMICNMLLPSRGSQSGDSSSSSSFAPPTPGTGTTGGAAGIKGVMTGGAASASSGSDLKLGEGVVACTVSGQSSSTTSAPFDLQNLAISYYPQRGTIMMMGGSEAQMHMIENFIKTNDVKQPQAYLEVSIVELNEAGSKEFANNWAIQSDAWGVKFSGGRVSGGREASPYDRVYDITKHYWTDPKVNDDGTITLPTYTAVTGKEKGVYNGSYISWTMNYLIENRKARVLANPKLLITNGQESTIDLTQDYVEKVTSEFLSSTSTGGAGTGTVQRTYTIGSDQGIKVVLTPFISPDGYVTLNIKPEYSTVAGEVRTPSETNDGSTDLQATLLSRRNLDLKNIRIKDGETLAIGGLIQENEQKTVQKIPVLGDLPVIGAAFRSSSTTKAKTELVIMLTPKIINDGENSVADSL